MSMFSFFTQKLKNLAKRYSLAYDKLPYTMAFLTMLTKGSIADYLTQTQIETRIENPNLKTNKNSIKTTNNKHHKKFDFKRNIKFSLFCGVYTGCAQHWIYNKLYQRLFPGIYII